MKLLEIIEIKCQIPKNIKKPIQLIKQNTAKCYIKRLFPF